MTRIDKLWTQVNLATLCEAGQPYGAIENGAIALAGDRIAWLGPMTELPAAIERQAQETLSGEGRWITPGLIDCHTHLVFGGNRANEFELRLQGASYTEIASTGGGIAATVKHTRAASEEQLLATAEHRLQPLLREGLTCIEIKSGYGLDLDNEAKMLRVARQLGKRYAVDVRTSFLGAHALPAEFKQRPDDYIDQVCEEMLPAIAAEGLADAVDAFCEQIAFSPAQTERLFQKARALGLPVKLHADQLSDSGGAALAARYQALSADHIEYSSEAGILAMAQAGTVAVLLPGAFYTLRETRLPPIDLLRRHGVPMAIATDANPGTSPACSLLLMLNMACTLFRLTPQEALAGVTRHAAAALGLSDDRGELAIGKRADLVFWDIEHPAELCYWLGANPCHSVIKDGMARPLPSSVVATIF